MEDVHLNWPNLLFVFIFVGTLLVILVCCKISLSSVLDFLRVSIFPFTAKLCNSFPGMSSFDI